MKLALALNIISLFAISSLAINSAFASKKDVSMDSHESCEGFLPESISRTISSSRSKTLISEGITKEEFESISELGTKAYKSYIKKFGADFTIAPQWDNNNLNATAIKKGSEWKVILFGGLAKFSGVTKDGYTVVLCHEIGHLVGGFPFYNQSSDEAKLSYRSTEGNADYFATHDCFQRLFIEDTENNKKAEENSSDFVKEICKNTHEDTNRQQICMRAINASHGFWSSFLTHLKSGTKVSLEQKDPKVVDKTVSSYPSFQCRVDTSVAGATCHKPSYEDNDYPLTLEEMDSLTCNSNEQEYDHYKGVRPRCWFNRKDY